MRGRVISAGAGVAVLIAGGAAIAFGQFSGSDTTPLGSDTANVQAVFDQPAARASGELARAVAGALPEIDVASMRRVLVDDRNDVYLARSLKSPSRICLVAAREESEGVWSGGTCAAIDAVSAGRVVVQLQDRAGGLGVPRTYYGLVPHGVRSVAASWGGTAAPTDDGVYAIRRATAVDGSGTLHFEVDGETIGIRLG